VILARYTRIYNLAMHIPTYQPCLLPLTVARKSLECTNLQNVCEKNIQRSDSLNQLFKKATKAVENHAVIDFVDEIHVYQAYYSAVFQFHITIC